MSTQNNNNGGLYFVVGALAVAVMVLGFLYINNDGEIENISPAAGVEKVKESVEESTNQLNLKIDENGISGSTSLSTEN